MAILACRYFDDELILDFGGMVSKTQRISHRLNEMWGIRYSENKAPYHVSVHILPGTCIRLV